MFTLTLTHFLAKTIFPEGMGGVRKTCGNSGGVGGLLLCSKKWKFRGGGGDLREFPPWWGYGYFLELHIVRNFLTLNENTTLKHAHC